MSRRIRLDLEGVIYIDGEPYGAGDSVPDHAVLDESRLEVEKEEPKKRAPAKKAASK